MFNSIQFPPLCFFISQICVSKCPEKFLTYMEIQFMYRKDRNDWTYYSQFCKSALLKPVKVCVFKLKTRKNLPCFNRKCNMSICNGSSSKIFLEVITNGTISLKHKCTCTYKPTHTQFIPYHFVDLGCYTRLLGLVS